MDMEWNGMKMKWIWEKASHELQLIGFANEEIQ